MWRYCNFFLVLMRTFSAWSSLSDQFFCWVHSLAKRMFGAVIGIPKHVFVLQFFDFVLVSSCLVHQVCCTVLLRIIAFVVWKFKFSASTLYSSLFCLAVLFCAISTIIKTHSQWPRVCSIRGSQCQSWINFFESGDARAAIVWYACQCYIQVYHPRFNIHLSEERQEETIIKYCSSYHRQWNRQYQWIHRVRGDLFQG